MINAKVFADQNHQKSYCEREFNLANGEEGDPELDRPLFIQVRAQNYT